MAKKRSRGKTRKKSKKDSPLWQWILVALLAFALYKGLDHFLGPDWQDPGSKKPRLSSAKKTQGTPSQKSPEPTAGPVKEWNFKAASRFLPTEAIDENFQPTPIKDKKGALLAYAKKIPGKNPGPQGLTDTRPGLRVLEWNGQRYDSVDLSFADLEKSLGGLSAKKFEGLPRLEAQRIQLGEAEIIPARIFLSKDNREVVAYLLVQQEGIRWAPLHHASGKKMPAAFVVGTTQKNTRKIQHQKHGGKNYLIVENGVLDEYKAYAGYQWNIQAYFWDGNEFTYDKEYSKKLTEAKKQ